MSLSFDDPCTVDEALRVIAQAFDGVKPPGPRSRTLAQANAWDDYREVAREGSHLGRWQDLPSAEILENQWAMPHLDAQGLRYYLPALMTHFLKTAETSHDWVHDSLVYTLDPVQGAGGGRDYQEERFRLLTPAHRLAILRFLQATEQSRGKRRAWLRAVEAGDAPDWYDRFNPA